MERLRSHESWLHRSGALGSELAKCFLKDHTVQVWDRHRAACDPLVQLGATAASSAADLGRSCDVVLLCLPRSSDVREVLFGPAGLAASLPRGTLVVDQTSGVPGETAAMAAQLARHGVDLMDAAVSGSPHVVAGGGATLLMAGPHEVLERARPLLHAITQSQWRCGCRVGDGQAMKLVNNAMNAGCRLATLEMVALGRRAGLSLASMTRTLNAGAGRNQTTDKMLPAIARGQASTNFALALMLKDVSQAVELGAQGGLPMTLVRTVRSLLQLGLNTLGAAARLEEMIGMTEAMAGTRLAAPLAAGVPEPQEQLAPLDRALWAICQELTLECLRAGLAYGLAFDTLNQVLARCSGWSQALYDLAGCPPEEILSRHRPTQNAAQALRAMTNLGSEHGAPALLANITCGLVDEARSGSA